MVKYNSLKLSSILVLVVLFAISGCTKEVPKDMQNTNKQQTIQGKEQTEMPNDSIHKNIKNKNGEVDNTKDSIMVYQLTQDADNADAKYRKTKSEADKQTAINTQMTAANFLMFQAESLSPKKKYRPALKRYNRVLEIDPNNKEAAANKKQIEDIYQSMGMPIPND